MSIKYIYNISDFSLGLIAGQLFNEIKSNVNISSNIINVFQQANDDVDLTFESVLSGGELSTANNIIDFHIPRSSRDIQLFTFQPVTIRSSTYESVFTFYFEGTNNGKDISEIKLMCKSTTNNQTYNIRLYDSTNNKVIKEETYSNNEFEDKILTVFSNIPKEESVIELQMKKNGGSGCIIKAFRIVE